MKARDQRRKVLLSARMRVGASWDDVRILNLSKRGMLVQAARPPQRGTYLELRRGAQAIVARVVWSAGNCFGAMTQDQINVEAIVRACQAGGDETGPTEAGAAMAERRSTPRPASFAARHDRSRRLARTLEFACLAAFGVGIGALLGQTLRQALAVPLTATSAALEQRR